MTMSWQCYDSGTMHFPFASCFWLGKGFVAGYLLIDSDLQTQLAFKSCCTRGGKRPVRRKRGAAMSRHRLGCVSCAFPSTSAICWVFPWFWHILTDSGDSDRLGKEEVSLQEKRFLIEMSTVGVRWAVQDVLGGDFFGGDGIAPDLWLHMNCMC